MTLRPSSGTGDVVGPASATDNAIVRFDATTGKLVQNSAATVADTSGDITGGTLNGVDITAHQARHAPGGADDLFSSVNDGEYVKRVGSALDGRHIVWAVKTGAQTESASSLTDVTDLVFSGLKSSTTYAYRFVLNYQTSVGTTGMLLAVNFSGTVTSTFYGVFGATASTTVVSNSTTTNNATVGATGTGPGTTNRVMILEGILNVGASGGTLTLRFQRGVAAGSATIQANSFGSLWETTS